jgi:hypothetical protein
VVRSVILVLMWMVVFGTSVTVIGLTLAVRSVCRANRVVPDRRTTAPIGWLWSLRAPARLHRRLRRAVAMVRAAVTPLAGRSSLSHLAEELAQRAAFIDDRLVAAAPTRWLLGGLAREVADVEADARRLTSLAHSWRTQLQQAALSSEPGPALDMQSRLDAFEAAMTELSRVGGTR